jgi:hypothetical protein
MTRSTILRCRGNVFNESSPSNDGGGRGLHIQIGLFLAQLFWLSGTGGGGGVHGERDDLIGLLFFEERKVG